MTGIAWLLPAGIDVVPNLVTRRGTGKAGRTGHATPRTSVSSGASARGCAGDQRQWLEYGV